MSQVWSTVCIFIHLSDNMQYLLSVTIGCALVLFLGWGLSTKRVVAQPLHYIFFPRCESIGYYQASFHRMLIYMEL